MSLLERINSANQVVASIRRTSLQAQTKVGTGLTSFLMFPQELGKKLASALGFDPYSFLEKNQQSAQAALNVVEKSVSVLDGTDRESDLWQRVRAGDDSAWIQWCDLADSCQSLLSQVMQTSYSWTDVLSRTSESVEEIAADAKKGIALGVGSATFVIVLLLAALVFIKVR